MKIPAMKRPGQIKSFRNNYLALATISLVLFTMSANAQWALDTGRIKTPVYASNGMQWVIGGFYYGLVPPRDTFRLAVRDTGALAFKNGTFYQWNLNTACNCYKWDTLRARGGSGGSTNAGSGLTNNGGNIDWYGITNRNTRIKSGNFYQELIAGDTSLANMYDRVRVNYGNLLFEHRDNPNNQRTYINIAGNSLTGYVFDGTAGKSSQLLMIPGVIDFTANDSTKMQLQRAGILPRHMIMVYDTITRRVTYTDFPTGTVTLSNTKTDSNTTAAFNTAIVKQLVQDILNTPIVLPVKAPLAVDTTGVKDTLICPTCLTGDSAVVFDVTNVAYKDSTQTLTNKTLAATIISGDLIPSAGYTYNIGSNSALLNKLWAQDIYGNTIRPNCGGCDFDWRFNNGGPDGLPFMLGKYSDKSVIVDKTGTFSSDGSDFQVKGNTSITGTLRVGSLSTGSNTDSVVVVNNGVAKKVPQSSISGGGGLTAAQVDSIARARITDSLYTKTFGARIQSRIGDSALINMVLDTLYIFGDSYAYAGQWARMVGAFKNWKIINYGVSGTNIDYLLSNLSLIPSYTSHRRIIIAYGINVGAYNTSTFQTDYQSVLNNAIGKGWTSGRPINLVGIPLTGSASAGALPYDAVISGLASSNGYNYISIRNWQLAHGGLTNMSVDSLHPSSFGYETYGAGIINGMGLKGAANLTVAGLLNTTGQTFLGADSLYPFAVTLLPASLKANDVLMNGAKEGKLIAHLGAGWGSNYEAYYAPFLSNKTVISNKVSGVEIRTQMGLGNGNESTAVLFDGNGNTTFYGDDKTVTLAQNMPLLVSNFAAFNINDNTYKGVWTNMANGVMIRTRWDDGPFGNISTGHDAFAVEPSGKGHFFRDLRIDTVTSGNISTDSILTYSPSGDVRKISPSALSGGGTSGTYTPTATGTNNVSTITNATCHYTRIGNEVTVYGAATVAASSGSSTSTDFTITLPVASNFTSQDDAIGTCVHSGAGGASSVAGTVYADTSGDVAIINWRAANTSAASVKFSFQYTVK